MGITRIALFFRMNKIGLTWVVVGHGILFIGLLLACSYQCYKCIVLYNLKETSVKMILMDATDERFPAISINPGFRQDILGFLGKALNDFPTFFLKLIWV